MRDISTISVRSQYAVCTPFVRRLYAVCTLICVHQYDLSTLFVRWFAYISTISVRNVLNLHDAGLKLAQLCIHIPILKNTNPSCRAHEPTHPYPSAWYETRTISVRYLDIRTISVRYPYDIWRTSGVHPAYIRRTSGVHQAPPMYASPPSNHAMLISSLRSASSSLSAMFYSSLCSPRSRRCLYRCACGPPS